MKFTLRTTSSYWASQKGLENMLNELCHASQRVGQKINSEKTKVMSTTTHDPISIEVQTIKQVEEYYPRQVIRLGRDSLAREIDWRGQLVGLAFWKLKDVFHWKIPQSLRTRVYNQCVPPVMTYACAKWTLTVGLIHKLENTFPTEYGRNTYANSQGLPT